MRPIGPSSFYDLLGVPATASPTQVRAAFLRLAQQSHPDLNRDDPHSERRFKQIRQVYEVLSDPLRRAAYDETPDRFHLPDMELSPHDVESGTVPVWPAPYPSGPTIYSAGPYAGSSRGSGSNRTRTVPGWASKSFAPAWLHQRRLRTDNWLIFCGVVVTVFVLTTIPVLLMRAHAQHRPHLGTHNQFATATGPHAAGSARAEEAPHDVDRSTGDPTTVASTDSPAASEPAPHPGSVRSVIRSAELLRSEPSPAENLWEQGETARRRTSANEAYRIGGPLSGTTSGLWPTSELSPVSPTLPPAAPAESSIPIRPADMRPTPVPPPLHHGVSQLPWSTNVQHPSLTILPVRAEFDLATPELNRPPTSPSPGIESGTLQHVLTNSTDTVRSAMGLAGQGSTSPGWFAHGPPSTWQPHNSESITGVHAIPAPSSAQLAAVWQPPRSQPLGSAGEEAPRPSGLLPQAMRLVGIEAATVDRPPPAAPTLQTIMAQNRPYATGHQSVMEAPSPFPASAASAATPLVPPGLSTLEHPTVTVAAGPAPSLPGTYPSGGMLPNLSGSGP